MAPGDVLSREKFEVFKGVGKKQTKTFGQPLNQARNQFAKQNKLASKEALK